uniref:Uncharacterized protein n=1 Tax=Tetranychus urticae TaxID=32264 RepID=T1JSX0_TETUR
MSYSAELMIVNKPNKCSSWCLYRIFNPRKFGVDC